MENKNINATDVIQFMSRYDLRLYKKVGSRAPLSSRVSYEQEIEQNQVKKGVVFVCPSKKDLKQGKGYIVTSYETLNLQKNDLTHWTPNIYRGGSYYDFKNRIIKGRTNDNLKQINVIGFDIDTKNVDLYEIFLACDELELPRPNILLSTPNGYQGFFVLETPFYIHKNSNFKAFRVAERIANNVLNALKKYVPIDSNCSPFGFFRIPNDNNIIYFNDAAINTANMISWSADYEETENKGRFHVIYPGQVNHNPIINSDWYRTLLKTTVIDKGYYSTGRNNTLLTLALANYASGISYEDSYDILDQFNSNLDSPLSKREFERTLKSAYSGRYNGPKREYVESLLELWTDGKAAYQGREGWYKFKKPRNERVRSHYEEWESDIIHYIESNSNPQNPYIEGSLRMLANSLGMAYSSLKEVLKRSTKIKKKTIGRGRAAITFISTYTMLFKHLIYKRDKARLEKQSMIDNFDTGRIVEIPTPASIRKMWIQEMIYLETSGGAPPIWRSG